MANKISNTLVTLSSAAILAVYTAGYFRTSSAADQFEQQITQRSATPPPVVAVPAVPVSVVPAITPAASPKPKATPAAASVPASTETPVPAAPGSEPVAVTSDQPKDEPPAPSLPAPATPQVQYKDGTYLGMGYSRHGNIQAFVVVEQGRIRYSGIEKCLTRWSCSFVEHLPPQVIARQNPEVDYVTGATDSGNAFYGAVRDAISKAK